MLMLLTHTAASTEPAGFTLCASTPNPCMDISYRLDRHGCYAWPQQAPKQMHAKYLEFILGVDCNLTAKD